MESDPLASRHFVRADRQAATSPNVSIVIVSKDPDDQLESRIASLRTRYDPARTEYVLAWAGSGRTSTGSDFRRRFPHVRVLSAPPSTSLADLRIQGIRAAAGDVVLLLQHNPALEAELADFPIAEREVDLRERSAAKWSVAVGSARERAGAAST